MITQNGGGITGYERFKTPEKEDRLSALPDSLIHHILSFLPSTKDAIRTSVLSKRWPHQWTGVPNLSFHFHRMSSDNSSESISRVTSSVSRFIDRTLIFHDCSKIKKFEIISDAHYDLNQDPNADAKLLFAIRKQAEEMILNFSIEETFRLPDFFFRQGSLVKLHLRDCSFMSLRIVHWGSLRDLDLENCDFDDDAVRNILSGSPLLQSLEMRDCYQSNPLDISSKSLKRLVLQNIDCQFDIWCPNLVEFKLMNFEPHDLSWCDKALEKFISDSPLLESLIFMYYEFPNIRISSKSLKILSFNSVICHEIEISCSHLEELELCDLDIEMIRLRNLPSSVSAALDIDPFSDGCEQNVVKQILEQLRHVYDLKLGSSFVGVLSERIMAGLSCPLLNGTSLILRSSNFEHIPGIVSAVCSSPVLERLVVILSPEPDKSEKLADLSDMDNLDENHWKTHLKRLVSNLRIVKIFGFSEREDKPKLVLDFVEFILKNSKLLETLVVKLDECGTDFVVKVSQKLLTFPSCSNAVIEL